MTTENDYLGSVKKQFLAYKILGEKAMEQLKEEQLFFKANENSNSIAAIVAHMSGNMLSRWTDFLTTDGEKPWRERDAEFEPATSTASELKLLWEKGWQCLFTTLNELTAGQLSATVYIRGEAHTVLDAINRQLTHYPYHVGQIIFAAKELKAGEWTSLSIPKRKSIA